MIVLILPIALILGTAAVIAASESPEIYHAIKRKAIKRKRKKQEKKVLKAFIKEATRQQTLDEETLRINQKLYELNGFD